MMVVKLSDTDRAPELQLSDDRLTLTGFKGYRTVRATNGVSEGTWYFEIKVLESQNENAHLRFGWGTKKSDIQAPVGFDAYSYAYRDIQGSSVHNSFRNDQYGEPFGPGDVVGAMISLRNMNSDDIGKKDQGSWIRFFKNGVDQGIAYTNLNEVEYYPSISPYDNMKITANFGPKFEFPPNVSQFKYLPLLQENEI